LSGKYPVASGLEHDEMGHPTASPKLHVEMSAKRRRKLQNLAAELPVPQVYGAPEGSVLLVGWGSTQGPLREAVDRARAAGDSVSAVSIRHINPLPPGLENIFSGFTAFMSWNSMTRDFTGMGSWRACCGRVFAMRKSRELTRPTG
jgi:2-oxoglutarate ferredoxin oxidoreductase subunit alpha